MVYYLILIKILGIREKEGLRSNKFINLIILKANRRKNVLTRPTVIKDRLVCN
jgi:hypothetical protein